MRRYAAIGLVLLMACWNQALAHGVHHTISEGAVAVSALYDDDSPMAFCDVAVFSPVDRETEYQTGTTDPNGCFAFLPDTNGVWAIVVDDGMGHRLEASVDIGSEGLRRGGEAAHAGRMSGAIVGISIIFGCCGLYAMFARRPGHSTATRDTRP